jgi:hypothetical protein
MSRTAISTRCRAQRPPRLKITPFMPPTTSRKNRAVFEAWTKLEAFRAAHSRAGGDKPLYPAPTSSPDSWRRKAEAAAAPKRTFMPLKLLDFYISSEELYQHRYQQVAGPIKPATQPSVPNSRFGSNATDRTPFVPRSANLTF